MKKLFCGFMMFLLLFGNLFSKLSNEFDNVFELIEKGNYKKALKIVDDYLTDNNDDAYVYFLRGIIKESLNDFKGALYDYRYSIYLDEEMLTTFKKGIDEIFKENKFSESSNDIITNKADNIYVARVNKSNKLFEYPDSKSRVISNISKNSYLFLNADLKQNGYYYIFDIKTGNEGWVKESNIILIEPISPSEKSLIDKSTEIYSSESELLIENSTNSILTLKIADNGSYKFQPYESRTITLKPGKYKLFASVPNAIPHLGWENLLGGYKHSIKYYITTEFKK